MKVVPTLHIGDRTAIVMTTSSGDFASRRERAVLGANWDASCLILSMFMVLFGKMVDSKSGSGRLCYGRFWSRVQTDRVPRLQ